MRRSPLRGGSRQGPRSGRYDERFALLLIAPAFFFYTTFLILPLFGTVVIGFTDWTGINFATLRFTGLSNFVKMAGDEFFWGALRNSFLFVACCLLFQVGFALLFAIVLESGPRLAKLLRSIFFVPFVVSLVVIGILFNFLLDPTLGIVDSLLRAIGLDGPRFGWLGTRTLNVFVVIAIHIWRNFGFTMFLLIAGLQAIPRELQESARLEGATPWQLTTRITIPLLREVLVVASVITSIDAMRVFDLGLHPHRRRPLPQLRDGRLLYLSAWAGNRPHAAWLCHRHCPRSGPDYRGHVHASVRSCPRRQGELYPPEGTAMVFRELSLPVRLLFYLILAGAAISILYPLTWMSYTSLKTNEEVMLSPFGLPTRISFENVVEAWRTGSFSRLYANSLLIAVTSVVGIITVSTAAAYGLAPLPLRRQQGAISLFPRRHGRADASPHGAQFQVDGDSGLLGRCLAAAFRAAE